MSRGRQVTRLLRLVKLLQRPQGVSPSEDSKELGCTVRTLYRDLHALEEVGYPLYAEPDGERQRWRLVAGFRHQHALPFNHDELTALWMAREALAALGGTAFAAGARSVVEKVRATLTDDVRRRLDRAQNALAVSGPARRYGGRAAIADTLRRGAEEHRTVELTYASLAGRRSRRFVDPYVLWVDPTAAALYVTGFDHDRREVRTFLVDRAGAASLTARTFEPITGWDARAHLAASFAAFGGPAVAVRLKFTGRAARLVEERVWHPSQTVAARPDGVVELSMRVPQSPGLRAWVLSWVPEVEVVSPGGLGREVVAALEAGLLAMGGRRRGVRGVRVTRGVTEVG